MFIPLSRRLSALALLAWRCSTAAALLAVAGCTIPQPGSEEKPTSATAASRATGPVPLGAAHVDAPEVANPATAVPAQRTQIIGGTGALVGTASRSGTGTGATAAAGDITLNFVNADVREVLPRVLGDILHLNYTIDPKVQANVTIQTSRPIAQKDVLPVLEETLRASGLALVEANA